MVGLYDLLDNFDGQVGGRGMFYESLVRSWFISPITQCPGVNAMVIHQHYHSLSLFDSPSTIPSNVFKSEQYQSREH